jgi:ribosome recycling factor
MELTTLQNLMKKTLDHFAHELSGLQIGKASTGLVSSIKIEAYGDRQAISQVASVTVMDAQTVKIEPWDKTL